MQHIKALKALADENRLRIIKILSKSDLCVGALARHLGISKPAVSQHLKILREADLVRGEKRGYWTHYCVKTDMINATAAGLLALSKASGTSPVECSRSAGLIEIAPELSKNDLCYHCGQQPEDAEGST